jgi:hypothetical protein
MRAELALRVCHRKRIIGFVSVGALRFHKGGHRHASGLNSARLAAQLAPSLKESEVSEVSVGIGRAAAIGAAMIPVAAAFTGCADLSPIDREFKDIQAQLKQVSSDVVAMESSLDKATEASRQAKEAADNAARTANQALAIALSAQRSVKATDERLEQLSPDHPLK